MNVIKDDNTIFKFIIIANKNFMWLVNSKVAKGTLDYVNKMFDLIKRDQKVPLNYAIQPYGDDVWFTQGVHQ